MKKYRVINISVVKRSTILDYIEKKAYAKINVALDVLSRRNDGYHNMKMIMQTINIYDKIVIKKNTSDSTEINIKSNKEITANKESNLVYKAVKGVLVKNSLLGKIGLDIYIEKTIPMEAGMAGGSADCATTILALNELLNLNMSMNEMMSIGKDLGSDVPYCLVGGTKLVEGVGDVISDLNDMPKSIVLVVKPKINVSTKDIFEKLNLEDIKKRPNFDKLITAINSGSIVDVSENLCNIFEEITIPIYPEIGYIKEIINSQGAYNSLMTGTGSTVFGFFENIIDAENVKGIIENKNIESVVITEII